MTYCDQSNQSEYPFTLPDLPYEKNAFEPHFSPETFDYHHGKHHNAYVTKLNALLDENKELIGMDLEDIIRTSHNTNPAIFNNAAQIWNHSFFWHSIKPGAGGKPTDEMLEKIEADFGSYEEFAEQFKQAAVGQFGSGWVWLVLNKNNKLEIVKSSNADNPLTEGLFPLIACDVWEHAYYIDFRNKRPDYVTVFLNHMLNWDFASMHMHRAMM